MYSKEQTDSKDKGNTKHRSLYPATEKLAIVAQPQTHPATIIQRAKLDPSSLTPRDVLQLQRSIGNQAVGRLLAQAAKYQLVAPKENKTSLPPKTMAGKRIVQRSVKLYGPENTLEADCTDFKSLEAQLRQWGLGITLRASDTPLHDIRILNEAIKTQNVVIHYNGISIRLNSGEALMQHTLNKLNQQLGIDNVIVAGTFNEPTLMEKVEQIPGKVVSATNAYMEKVLGGDVETWTNLAGPTIFEHLLHAKVPVKTVRQLIKDRNSFIRTGRAFSEGRIKEGAQSLIRLANGIGATLPMGFGLAYGIVVSPYVSSFGYTPGELEEKKNV